MSQQLELVSLETEDQIVLDGAWYPVNGSKQGALLVHGRAQNFYTSVARWLAPYLAGLGFSTLSLNMRDHDHSEIDGIPGSAADIATGVNFLLEQGCEQYVFVGISYGSNKTALFLPGMKNPGELAGMIVLPVGGIKTYLVDVWQEVLACLAYLQAPLLVIQAGADEHIPNPEVAGREVVEAASPTAPAQLVVIQDANHGFSGHKEEVFSEITTWLTNHQLIPST